MSFKQKLLILIIAVVLTVIGFNLIASSSVNLLRVAKEAGYETIEDHLSRCDASSHLNPRVFKLYSVLYFDSNL